MGLRYGGVLRVGKTGLVERRHGSHAVEESDFFDLEMSDPMARLPLWSRELERLIAVVRERDGGVPVVLVGFSAGGLAGRKYLVDHPLDHGVAKLVTISAPHRGSELASLARQIVTLTKGAEPGSLARRALEGLAGKLRSSSGIPLDAPLLEDLLPERENAFLETLNRSPHPANVEYSCLVTVGSPGFEDWRDLGGEIGALKAGEVRGSRLGEFLLNKLQALLQPGADLKVPGDGAVLAASQDLGKVAFFERNADRLKPCLNVEAGHSSATTRYEAVLSVLASPPHFLAARRGAGSTQAWALLEVDFEQNLAGLAKVTARSTISRKQFPVLPPALFQRGGEAMARVVIGPFDSSREAAIEVILEGPEGGHSYGKRIRLGGPGRSAALARPAPLEPVVFTLRSVADLPSRNPSGELWDIDGSPPDLQAVLLVNQAEILRTETFDDAAGRVTVQRAVRLDANPWSAELRLELWDVDFAINTLMGRIVWNPGELPRGVATARTERGITVEIEVDDPNRDRIEWDGEPFPLLPS